MTIEPDYAAFESKYAGGISTVLWTEVSADLETPVSAYLKLTGNTENSFLFESVEGGVTLGRYSFIGMSPDLIWKYCADKKCTTIDNEVTDTDPLTSLRQLLDDCHIDLPEHLPPSSVGIFGYMGYDMIRLTENIPDKNPDTLNLPDSVMIRPTLMAIFDNIKHTITLVTPVWHDQSIDAKMAYKHANAILSQAVERLQTASLAKQSIALNSSTNTTPIKVTSNTTKDEYSDMVASAKEYILGGDIFQVVLSQRFEMDFPLPAFDLYRSLRRLNPSPFLFFVNLEGFALVGSSPEILVRVRDETVTIRPIAGTRKRGATPAEDKELMADLLSDPKELAEHLMLLDLGRNDIGRVAKIGTVDVTEQYNVELYSHVMHIVSNVEGKLKDGLDGLDALFSGFPAGTVSGAPKIRAMEIIDELEKHRRSFYAGCVGYLGADGSVDSCITLRTGLVKDGKLYVQAGGGIVADSTAEGEYQESQNKARALIAAAEQALSAVNS